MKRPRITFAAYHAVLRYRERICPTATYKQAERQLLEMANNAEYDGPAERGCYKLRWGDVGMIVEGGRLVTLYWKRMRVREREKVSIRKYLKRKR